MTSQPSELRELHDDELETRLREAKVEARQGSDSAATLVAETETPTSRTES